MSNNQILLLQPIKGLGAEGETVSVRAGYARNYLLPRKLALPITQANKKHVEALLKARESREQKEFEDARTLSEKVEKTSIAIAVKTGEGGKMFGAVTANDLIERLKEEGIELTKKQLLLPLPIKELGSHTAEVKIHADVETELKFEVVSENPIEEVADSEEDYDDEDDEARRAREAKEREAFKASVKGGKRLFPKGIDPKDYTIEQLAFLSRKEQGIMPDMNDCAICDGVGTLICTACHGTGTNPRSNSDKFGDTVMIYNDSMHSGMLESMLTQEGGICWICRGAKHIACTSCEGSGKRDFAENYICD